MPDRPPHLEDLDRLKARAARLRGLPDRKRVAGILLDLLDDAHDRYGDRYDTEILAAAGWDMATLGQAVLDGEMGPAKLVALVMHLYAPPGMSRIDRNRLVTETSVVAILALRRARHEPFVRGLDQSEEEAKYDGPDPLVTLVEPIAALRWLNDRGLMPPVAAALIGDHVSRERELLGSDRLGKAMRRLHEKGVEPPDTPWSDYIELVWQEAGVAGTERGFSRRTMELRWTKLRTHRNSAKSSAKPAK